MLLEANRAAARRAATLGIGTILTPPPRCANETPPPAPQVDNPAAGTAERPSNLSYGTVTATVKKNVTTQAELIDMFGGPNISTTDKDGTESWVYERTASMCDTAGTADQKASPLRKGKAMSPAPILSGMR